MANLTIAALFVFALCIVTGRAQQQSNFTSDILFTAVPNTAYSFSVSCAGTATASNFRFQASPICSGGAPTCALSATAAGNGRYSWICSSSATYPILLTSPGSPVQDVCESFVDIVCIGASSSTEFYRVSQVLGGVPSIVNATSFTLGPTLITGAGPFSPIRVSLRGTDIPGNVTEIQNNMQFRWTWYRSLTGVCANAESNTQTIEDSMITLDSSLVFNATVSPPSTVRLDAYDGCVLQLDAVSRRGMAGNVVAVSTRRIAAYAQQNPKFSTPQPRRGYYLPSIPSTVAVQMTGVGLPRQGEALFVRTNPTNGALSPAQSCFQADLNTEGTLIGCTYNVTNIGTGTLVANFSLTRQNVPQWTDWVLIRFFNTLPVLGNPTDLGFQEISGIIAYFEGSASYPRFRISIVSGMGGVSLGDTAVVKDSFTCPQYIVTCAELTAAGMFECTVQQNFSSALLGRDCKVGLIPYKWDVPGLPGSIVVLAEQPFIYSVSPYLLPFSEVRTSTELQITGNNFYSSDSGVNNFPTVTLAAGTESFGCSVSSVTATNITCVATIPLRLNGVALSVTVTRYSLSATTGDALKAEWIPLLNQVSPPVRIDPFATDTAVSFTGARICLDALMWAQIVEHPAPTPLFTACRVAGENMTVVRVSGTETQLDVKFTAGRVNNPNCAVTFAISCNGGVYYSAPVFVGVMVQAPLTFVPFNTVAAVGSGQVITPLQIDFVGIDYDRSFTGFQVMMNGAEYSNCAIASAPANPPTRETQITCTIAGLTAATTVGAQITVKAANAELLWGVVTASPAIGSSAQRLTVFDVFPLPIPNITVTLPLYNMNTDIRVVRSLNFAVSISSGGDSGLNCPGQLSNILYDIADISSQRDAVSSNYTLSFNLPIQTRWDRCLMQLTASLYGGSSPTVLNSVTRFVARPYINETWDATGQILTLNPDGVSLDLNVDNILGAFFTPVPGESFSPVIYLASSPCSLTLATSSFGNRPTTVPILSILNVTAPRVITLENLRSQGTIDGCSISAKLQRTSDIGSDSYVFVGRVAVEPLNVVPTPNDRIFTNIISMFNITGEFVTTPLQTDSSIVVAPRANCNAASPAVYNRRGVDGRSAAALFNVRTASTSTCTADVVLVKYGTPVWLRLLDIKPAPVLSNPTSGVISARVLGTHGSLTQTDQVAAAYRQFFGLSNTEFQVSLTAAKRDAMNHENLVFTFSDSNGRNTYDSIVATPESLAFFSAAVSDTLTAQAGSARTLDGITFSSTVPSSSSPQAQQVAPSGNSVAGGDGPNILPIILAVVFSIVAIVIIVVIAVVIIKRRKQQKGDQKPAQSAEMDDKSSSATKQNAQYGALRSGDPEPTKQIGNTYGSINTTGAEPSRKGVLKVEQDDDSGSEADTDHLDNLSKMMQSEFDSKWYIPFEDIKFLKVLGRGAYGQVHKAKWNGGLVAVKQTMALQIDQTGVEEFKHEAKLLLNLQPHPNVVQVRQEFDPTSANFISHTQIFLLDAAQVFGISINNGSLFLIMEYCGLGSLDKYLTKNKLEVPTKVRVLSECARGLYHLHSAGIVHRDIAMRNILVGRGGVPKISDFGMSRTIVGQSAENKTASNVGPLKWMAPESLSSRVYGTKTDVYTYGVLISEVFTEAEPFPDMELLQAATQIRDNGLVPTLPEDVPPPVVEIAHRCWDRDPEKRPDMKKVVSQMSDIVSELAGDESDHSSSEESN